MNDAARKILAVILVALAGVVGITVTVVDNGDDRDPKTPKRTVTIKLDRSAAPGVQAKTVEVPKTAIVEAQQSTEIGTGENLRDESPPGIPEKVLDANDAVEEKIAESDQLPIVTPLAAPSQRGCHSRFVRNYSSRRGVAPRWIVIHLTVSPNLPGLRDLLGLTALANNPRSQVSWTYAIDRDGNCFYSVRESDKPWTQAAANPFSIGIENVNTTREFPFMRPAGYRKLGLVVSDAAKRWNIPLRLGSSRNCAPGRAGILSHAMLGACAGNHSDIGSHDGPPNGSHPELRKIIGYAIAARRQSAPKLTKKAKWSLRHAALHKIRRPLTRTERSKNRAYHRLLRRR